MGSGVAEVWSRGVAELFGRGVAECGRECRVWSVCSRVVGRGVGVAECGGVE